MLNTFLDSVESQLTRFKQSKCLILGDTCINTDIGNTDINNNQNYCNLITL